jgi:hypothetical protein
MIGHQMRYDLSAFGFNEMMDLRARLRSVFDVDPPDTIEEASQRVVTLFRDSLLDREGNPACALVRLYKTHPFADLDDELKDFARKIAPEADHRVGMRCLVLVSTAGQEPEWNDRRLSRGHRAIPLTSEKTVEEAPMVAQLIKQLGLDVATVLRPDPALLLDMRDRTHNVFFVPRALGSPFIVAQKEFVVPYGIESVLGFGGMMSSGDLVAAILFSKVPIARETADQFKVIGLNFKLAMLSVARKPLFSEV